MKDRFKGEISAREQRAECQRHTARVDQAMHPAFFRAAWRRWPARRLALHFPIAGNITRAAIWGRLDSNGPTKNLELWFVSSDRAEPAGRAFSFHGQKLQLDDAFPPEMGAALAAVAASVALPVASQPGTAVAYRLSLFVDRLK